jgi:hypothetical protein
MLVKFDTSKVDIETIATMAIDEVELLKILAFEVDNTSKEALLLAISKKIANNK